MATASEEVAGPLIHEISHPDILVDELARGTVRSTVFRAAWAAFAAEAQAGALAADSGDG